MTGEKAGNKTKIIYHFNNLLLEKKILWLGGDEFSIKKKKI